MKKIKNVLIVLFALLMANNVIAQDPSFSQFFSSPLNVNPALTGNINGKWRVISNLRRQWSGMTDPYMTGTISADSKIFQNIAGNETEENTRIAIGGMMMYDQAMAGALKSNYASFNVSGKIKIGSDSHIRMDEDANSWLGAGIGIIYGNKQLNTSKLNFAEQFTGSGFDVNLPTGESALSNMKPYISTSVGLLYSYDGKNTNFDLGVSAFHLNKPRQTFLNDPKQFLAPRYVVHSNFETFLSDNVILYSNGIYQYQSGASYFSIGGALGYYLSDPDGDKEVVLNAGLWYWSNNAVLPYIGFSSGNYQVGLTYDITVSKLHQASLRTQTFELSLVLRGKGNHDGPAQIQAPWK